MKLAETGKAVKIGDETYLIPRGFGFTIKFRWSINAPYYLQSRKIPTRREYAENIHEGYHDYKECCFDHNYIVIAVFLHQKKRTKNTFRKDPIEEMSHHIWNCDGKIRINSRGRERLKELKIKRAEKLGLI